MVVGPEYNAIMGVALGIDKRDRRAILRGNAALLAGFSAAIIVTLLFGLAIRWSGQTPKAYSLGVRPVSSLIDKPNLFSVVVAVLAGIVGVVSLTESRASTLIGVFISVTTIPAASDVALSAAYANWTAPVARRLRVGRPARSRPLLVGGDRWVIDLGRALRSAGLQVLMWAGLEEQREAIRQAGLELAPGELLAAATGRGARLEEITAVLLLTDEDDFNALASVLLADCVDGGVYRLAPPQRSQGVVAPYTGGEILFGDGMTRPAVSGRYHDGARITAQHADGALPAGHDVLFLVRADGRLTAVTQTDTPVPQAGDTIVSSGAGARGSTRGWPVAAVDGSPDWLTGWRCWSGTGRPAASARPWGRRSAGASVR